MNDFELIQGCISGDKDSWDQFAERFSRLIYDSILRTFRKYGKDIDNDTVDDLHNDVFVSLLDNQYKALKIFEGRNGCQLASYIRTISVRKTIDFLRKLRPTTSIEADGEREDGGDPRLREKLSVSEADESVKQYEMTEISEILLNELKEEERRFCQMMFTEKQSPEDIADKLNISVDNVYVRKQRILNKLKEIARNKNIC